jgi:exopolysaccharide biosynthesis polyprenyl glycosylphosphotransferase
MLFGALRVPLDALAVFASLVLAYRLREASVDLIPGRQLLDPPVSLPGFDAYLWSFVIPAVVLFLCIALPMGLYAFQVTRSAWSEVGRAWVAAMLWLVLILAWYFLFRRELFYSRILLLHSTLFIVLFVALVRASLTVLYRSLLRFGYGVRLVVSVGKRSLSKEALRTLEGDVRYRYLGHAPELADLKGFQRKVDVDLAIQTDPATGAEDTLELIEYCRSEHIGYAFLPPVFADTPHLLAVDRLGLLPMVRFQPTPLDGWGRVIKRFCDVVGSLALLVVLSPLLLLITLLILIDSGLPILYVSTRVGDFGKKHVRVLKFRSMVRDADRRKEELKARNHRIDGPLFKIKDDPRVTRVGRWLRRTSLDELPQLFNVLKGDMALVGPRPHLPEEVTLYTQTQRRVFAVRPGMTGLAQISGRSDLRFEDEVRLDLQYIEEWSILLDIWILWRTVVVVWGKRGAD